MNWYHRGNGRLVVKLTLVKDHLLRPPLKVQSIVLYLYLRFNKFRNVFHYVFLPNTLQYTLLARFKLQSHC